MFVHQFSGLPNQEEGFSLIQLMITLAIVAILTSISVPSFSRSIAKSKIAEESNQLADFLRYSRQEAINRGNQVTLCSSNSSDSCASSNWSQWVVQSSVDNSFATTPLLLRKHVTNDRIQLQVSGNVSSITFQRLGTVAQKYDFWICHPSMVAAKKLTLESSGYIVITDVSACGSQT